MRMWMINPVLMCSKHLVGEHGELHKFRHIFVKKHNVFGRVFPEVQIEVSVMKKRHDELASFMNHKSPFEMPDISYLSEEIRNAKIDIDKNLKILREKCPECAKKQKSYFDSLNHENIYKDKKNE